MIKIFGFANSDDPKDLLEQIRQLEEFGCTDIIKGKGLNDKSYTKAAKKWRSKDKFVITTIYIMPTTERELKQFVARCHVEGVDFVSIKEPDFHIDTVLKLNAFQKYTKRRKISSAMRGNKSKGGRPPGAKEGSNKDAVASAMGMKSAGYTWSQIMDTLGVSRGTLKNYFDEGKCQELAFEGKNVEYIMKKLNLSEQKVRHYLSIDKYN